MTQETERSKRHLSYLKNLFASHLFESGAPTSMLGPPAVLSGNKQNFKLYRIPGFDNILVKAVPKVKTNLTNDDTNTATTPPSEEEEREPEVEKEREPAVAILESYLGTKSLNDTVKALQGVRDMLQSGVLTAQREAAEDPLKETVFVIPPMTPRVQFQPVVIKPTQVPVTPYLSHIAPFSMVQNVVLPGLKPLPVQTILPVSIIPSAFEQVKDGSVTSFSSPNVVTQSINPSPPPSFLVNRLQHMINMPLAPSLSMPSYVVPRLMNPVNVVNMPIANTSPIFVEPSNVAVKGYPYPYKPCCKSPVAIPAKPSYLIEETVRPMRPPLLVKDTIVVPRPPSIIVERLENIAGGKIFTQRPIITTSFAVPLRDPFDEQSKYVNVHPLPATWTSPVAATKGNESGQRHSYKVVNSDGNVITFSKLWDDDEHPGYYEDMDGDDGYYQTDDGRIFYSRLVKDPALEMSKEFQDEERKKHKKTQYTVTNVEEFKNLLNHDDVHVTYGTDKDSDPFQRYLDSFQQVKKFSKLTEDNLPPLQPGAVNEQTSNKGNELPHGPSKYSFKQIHQDGSITQYIAYDSNNSDVAVLNNVQDFKDTKENLKGEGQTPIPGLTLNESSYLLKQIDPNNSQSGVGHVEDTPTRFGDKGEDQDKFNAHAHVSSDRLQNWGTEAHSVPLSISSTLPKDAQKDDVPFISTHKAENEKIKEKNSFNTRAILNPEEPSTISSHGNIPAFSNTNPIVVSSQNEEEGGFSSRGDIPDAYS